MSENFAGAPGVTWLPLPDFAARLGVRDRDVRSWIRDRRLLAVRPGPGLGPHIPEGFLLATDGGEELLPSLQGTITLLGDCGLTDDEAMAWLLTPQDELGQTPLTALRDGRTRAVRTVASTLLL